MKTTIAILCLALLAPVSFGQNSSTGFPPFGTFQQGQFDSINLENLNVNFAIPLPSAPGRGISSRPQIVFNSGFWQTVGHPAGWGFMGGTLGFHQDLGWTVDNFMPAQLYYNWQQQTCTNDHVTAIYYYNFEIIEPNGTVHPFSVNFYTEPSNCWATTPQTGVATDASGYYLNATNVNNFLAYTPSGAVVPVFNGCCVMVDPNGNEIQQGTTYGVETDTDTLARTALQINETASPWTYVYKDSNGNSQTISVTFQSFSIRTNFGCQYITDYSGTASLPVSISYPNGQSYSFQYEATAGYSGYTTGRVSQVTLPTGGTYQYQYGASDCSTGGIALLGLTRTITNGMSVATWQYSRVSGNSPTTTVTAPQLPYDLAANQRYITWVLESCSYPYSGSYCWLETDKTYQGSATSGSLLKTVATLFDNEPSLTLPGGIPVWKTVTLGNGQESEVTTSYDQYGNLLQAQQYDWGNGAPGPLLRTVTNTYLNSSTYLNIGISNRLSSTVIANGSGTTVAQTQYEYDNYTAGITASGAVQHNSSYGTNYTTRGNVTAVKRWRNTDNSWLTTRFQYDDAGNVLSSTDPKSNTTTFSYSDYWNNTGCTPSGGNGAAYITTTTNALTQKTTAKYNSCTGSAASATDANSQTTSYTYDLMGRITAVAPPGGQTTYTYNDTAPISLTTNVFQQNSMNRITTMLFDGLGGVKQTQLDDPQGTDYTDTTYDLIGRVYSTSNPYRSTSDPTYGIASQNYDALGRPTTATAQDGQTSTLSYTGNCATATDPSGKNRETCINGLGQLTKVIENPGGLAYETDYQYDVLNNLTSVTQSGSRPRTFVYDSLSETQSATNPESGKVTYTYDNNGNVSTRVDARNITTTYSYDALNRLTGKTYSDGTQPATYVYDTASIDGYSLTNTIGRLVKVSNGTTTAPIIKYFSYDSRGHIHQDWDCLLGNCFAFTAYYDPGGDLSQIVYPSGRAITYSTDTAGRQSIVQDVANNIMYVEGQCPSGGSSNGTCFLGPGFPWLFYLGHTIIVNERYNPRLQPCRIDANTAGTGLSSCTDLSHIGNLFDLSYSFVDGSSHNNGNLIQETNNRDNTRSQSFTYDALNRVSTAQTASTYSTSPANCWSENYGYDQWANLLSISPVSSSYNGCTVESLSLSVNAANQITNTGYSYDASGDVLKDGTNTYTWDAESRLSTAAGVTYSYDALGNRVEKSNGTLYLFGPAGQVLAETTLTGSLINEYIYFNGQKIARRDSSGNILYYLADHLGTSRVLAQSNGTLCYDADFYPFGVERTPITNSCPQNYKFTGYEHDSETGLNDTLARMHSPNTGRFMSPDPLGGTSLDPQTLNRYSYVRNTPTVLTDPTGREINGLESFPVPPLPQDNNFSDADLQSLLNSIEILNWMMQSDPGAVTVGFPGGASGPTTFSFQAGYTWTPSCPGGDCAPGTDQNWAPVYLTITLYPSSPTPVPQPKPQCGGGPCLSASAQWVIGRTGVLADAEFKGSLAIMATVDGSYVGGIYAPEIADGIVNGSQILGNVIADATETASSMANQVLYNPSFIENGGEFLSAWDPANNVMSVPKTVGGWLGWAIANW